MCGGAWVKEEWAKNLKHSGLVAEKLKAAVQVRRSPLGSSALLAEGIHPHQLTRSGVVAEWFKAAVLKTAKGETPS